MKRTQILLTLVAVFFISAAAFAQDAGKRNSVGIQLNPYLDSHFFDGTFFSPVFAGRYGYSLNKHLTVGPEISGYFVLRDEVDSDLNISSLNFGGFLRYSLMPASRIRPFFELSPYYTFYHFKSESIVTQEGVGKEYRDSWLSGYLSPGLTLYSKNRRFSLDLMYKFSNKDFINGNKSVFTYRLNFNF